MDIQKGYNTGSQWALDHVGDMQHLDSAFARVDNLLPTLSINLKVISIQFCFNDSSTDTELINSVVAFGQRRHVPNFIKRRNNMMEEPKIATYIHSAIDSNEIKHIIIIGCTITSCIWESALALKTNRPNIPITVDLFHRGGLSTRGTPICQDCMMQYLADIKPSTGVCTHYLPIGPSPIQYGVEEMRGRGTTVDTQLYWNRLAKVTYFFFFLSNIHGQTTFTSILQCKYKCGYIGLVLV